MDKWIQKVAVVTGASSGIGAAIAKDFARSGIITIGLARRVDRMEVLKLDLDEYAENFHSMYCDVADEECIKRVFATIDEQFGGVNILVNNAGLATSRFILSDEDSNQDVRDTINVNVLGLVYCTREAFKILKRTKDIGYIININSVEGHSIPCFPTIPPPFNIYPASKHAVTAISEVVRQELFYLQLTNVRISCISPGLVQTEILTANYEYIEELPILQPDDIIDGIRYVLSTPAHVQVRDIIIKPVGEPY